MIYVHGISQDTFDFVVTEEVTSKQRFERLFRRLTYPGVKSGPTGGIGYDFGQATRAQIRADWEGKVPDAMLKALASCAGVTGPAARALTLKLHDVVDIPWDVALDVFSNHDLPRYTAMCRAHIPGYDALSPHCKGVLFSLAQNRGPSFDAKGTRYAEMRDIKAAIVKGDLARVPALIRSMKRLWKDDPDAKGLLARRDGEAKLWELGLQEHHPEAYPKLAEVAPVMDPEVVAHIQEQLRNLGYYQVGSADGSLTPQGRTEAAILAFRNHEGLPLMPAIDDDLINALAKAQPPEIAEQRTTATVDDLREQGSETIRFTDKAKAWAGRLFGGGTSLGATGALALVTERANQLNSAKEAVGNLGITPQMLLIAVAVLIGLVVLAAMGLGIWYVADRIEARRLADYRSGKHP
jgi:hypothetical protein